jgi:hypothetical protein
MKKEPEMHVVKRDDGLYMEPVNPPKDRVGEWLKNFQRNLEELNPARQMQAMEAQTSRIEQLRLKAIRRKARMEAEAIEREEALLREIAILRQLFSVARRARQRPTNVRARPEERTDQIQAKSDKRERLMVALTAATVILAIAAIVVTIIVA